MVVSYRGRSSCGRLETWFEGLIHKYKLETGSVGEIAETIRTRHVRTNKWITQREQTAHDPKSPRLPETYSSEVILNCGHPKVYRPR